MTTSEPTSFTALMQDSDAFMAEVNKAVHNTLRVHKLLGYPVAVWRDGQVVWVPPEQIPIREEANGELPQLPT
jgi:hypothetical protein